MEILSREQGALIWLEALTLVGVVIGFLMAIFGYKNWYNLVQKPMDERLKIELENLKNNSPKQASP